MTPATKLTFDGIEQPITEWALDYGIVPAVIIARLERGLSIEQAITTPMVTAPGQRLTGKHLDSYILGQRSAWQRDRNKAARSNRCANTTRPRTPRRSGKQARPYTFDGKTMTLPEWASHIGKSASTLGKRIAAGWPIERALSPTDGRADRHRPGVVFDFDGPKGTGAGSSARKISQINFAQKAENA
jgi:hypothetical protein